MSKNRVWNRGKHNGAGLSKKAPAAAESEGVAETAAPEDHSAEVINERIDTVKPMNRSNWVTRPARVKPQNPERNKK
ncbi:hypothetical protein MKX42_14625 [Paenibacillus sp. FSL R7-0204]|uniref:hypothetical protein n=1 Tax=Paenibacillus sp. FSL R7-0204 TaxID=2921675 RepID=UPI0030FC7B9D